jgi:outer membrane receptor for ferrienterochelin and colicins
MNRRCMPAWSIQPILHSSPRHHITSGLSFNGSWLDETSELAPMDYSNLVPGAYAEYSFKPNRKNHVDDGHACRPPQLFWHVCNASHAFSLQPLGALGNEGFGRQRISPSGRLGRKQQLVGIGTYPVGGEQPHFGGGLELWCIRGLPHSGWGARNRNQCRIFPHRLPQPDGGRYGDDGANIIVDNLNGQSFANSYQVDVRFEPLPRLDVTMAMRINDVKQTIGGQLVENR